MKLLLKFLVFFLVLVLIFGVSDSLVKSITGGTSLIGFVTEFLNVSSDLVNNGGSSTSEDETTAIPKDETTVPADKETEAPEETQKPLCKNHTYLNAGITDFVSPTCETKGSYKNTCTVCGYVKTETQAALGHSYGEYSYYSEAQHVKVCERSGCGQKKYADHSYDGFVCTGCSHVLPIPDDCTHSYGSVTGTGEYSSIDDAFHEEYCTMTCEICGHVEYLWDGFNEHSFEYTSYDDYHTGACTYCAYSLGSESHTFVNGECSKCGRYASDSGDSGGSTTCSHDNLSDCFGDSDGCWNESYYYCMDCNEKVNYCVYYTHTFTADGVCSSCGASCDHSFQEDFACVYCGKSFAEGGE